MPLNSGGDSEFRRNEPLTHGLANIHSVQLAVVGEEVHRQGGVALAVQPPRAGQSQTRGKSKARMWARRVALQCAKPAH